jgi:Tat protein secretion system quality control protein TatD with DNase activity
MYGKNGYCDFHCHLDDERFEQNRKQIIDQCFSQGIVSIISVADPFEKKIACKN